MLENIRFNSGLNSLSKITDKYPRINAGYERQILFEENYKTQLSLARLNASSSTPPSSLPEIGSPKFCQLEWHKDTNLPLFIELLGMPNTGKTSVAREFADRNGLYFREESYTEARDRASFSYDPFSIQELIKRGFATSELGLIQEIREENLPNMPR